MAKTLVLIRHAHRDTSTRELDNGLDDKGRDQARNIKRFFTDRFADYDSAKGIWFVSSPKIRCIETLVPAAKSRNAEVDVHPGLDEKHFKESGSSFEERVNGFIAEWERSTATVTLACSHGDWLPVAVHRLLGLNLEHKKGAWLELEREGGFSLLKWYLPSFKSFYR